MSVRIARSHARTSDGELDRGADGDEAEAAADVVRSALELVLDGGPAFLEV